MLPGQPTGTRLAARPPLLDEREEMLREQLRSRSAAVLQHQLELERAAAGRGRVVEVAVWVGLLGLGAGVVAKAWPRRSR